MKHLFFLGFLLTLSIGLNAQNTNGYCFNKGTRGNTWLQKVSIGNWSSNSGSNSGYLYQADSELVLNADTSYAVQLDLGGYPRVQDTAYWSIWIDFNLDLDFNDAGEQIFQNKTVFKGVAKGTLKLPLLLEAEKYMMRIVVAKSKFSPPCGESTTIEIEDYLTQINPALPCNAPKAGNIQVEEITDNQAILSVKDLPALKYTWHIESENGKFSKDIVQTEAKPIVLEGLNEKTKYKVRLKIECEEGESRWSSDVTFTTLVTSVCFPPDKNNISVAISNSQNARLSYKGSEGRNMEWRYRIQGSQNWDYNNGNNPYIPIPSRGAFIEVQARWFCDVQNNWTSWSETHTADLRLCSFPIEKDISISSSFIDFPNLNVSLNFSSGYGFNLRWYYRKKGAQEWIDTIKTNGSSVNILNLAPGTTYEVRVDLHCNNDSVSFFRTVESPTSCLNIDSTGVYLSEISDTSVVALTANPGNRIYEYRFKEKGDSAFTTVRSKNWRVTGLKPNTTYELSIRVVCEDSIPNWSPWVLFTTKGCSIPLRGDLGVVQAYLPDSIRYRVEFINNFTKPENFQYHWKYKATNEKNWQESGGQNDIEVLFKNLKKGVKYDVKLSVYCRNKGVDSLSLANSFTAIKDDCFQKPDTAAISIKGKNGPSVQFKSPRGYDFQLRVKPADSPYFGYYFQPLSDLYSYGFSIFPGVVNDIQYRYVCPGGNLSPWSDVIKFDNTKNFTTTELQQFVIEGREQNLLDQAKLQLRIAPNPSSGQFSIFFPAEMEPQPEAKLEILNTAGQRIWSLKTSIAPTQTLPIDLSRQTPGLYILRIQAGQKVYTERIMIASNR